MRAEAYKVTKRVFSPFGIKHISRKKFWAVKSCPQTLFVQFAIADGIVSIYTFCVSHCAGANSRGHLMLRTRDVIFSAGERVCPHLVVGGAGCSLGDAMCLGLCAFFSESHIV
jgi:hypothetical protein